MTALAAQRVALWLESALANYLHHDHLSIRVMTNQLSDDVVGTQGH